MSTPAAKLLLGTIEPAILAGLLYCGAGLGVAVLRRAGWFASRQAASSFEVALGREDVPYLAGAIVAGGVAGTVLLMAGLQRTDASATSLLLTLEVDGGAERAEIIGDLEEAADHRPPGNPFATTRGANQRSLRLARFGSRTSATSAMATKAVRTAMTSKVGA